MFGFGFGVFELVMAPLSVSLVGGLISLLCYSASSEKARPSE